MVRNSHHAPLFLYKPFISAAENTRNGEKCAIKKVCKLFERPILTKRALRELKLLEHFNGHKNVNTCI